MDVANGTDARVQVLVTAALDGTLTEQQADELAHVDPDLQKLAWMAAARRIAELRAKGDGPPVVDPATPSAQRPVYTKPAAPKRNRKPGAKQGHPGRRRPAPARVDERAEHRLEACPDCGGPLQQCT